MQLEVEADGNVTLRALELERLLQNLTDQLEEKKKSKVLSCVSCSFSTHYSLSYLPGESNNRSSNEF